MKTEIIKIKNFGDVKINIENEVYHCVYLTKTSDGFTIIGQTNDGLYSRTKHRLLKKKEFSIIKHHLISNKFLDVKCIFETEDDFTKNVVEQYLIVQQWENLIKKYNNENNKNLIVDFYNISSIRKEKGIKEFVDKMSGNSNLDHKEDLRYYLAHKEKFPHIKEILSTIKI